MISIDWIAFLNVFLAALLGAGSIVLFRLVGMWLDRKLGTDPWLLIVGVFTGGAAGFWSMYRRLVVLPRERDRQ